MIRALVLALCCVLAGGCIVPHIERFEPLALERTDRETGEVHRLKIPTRLIDPDTKQEIKDADAVLIISRGPAYLPDSRQGPSKHPKVAIARFNQLDRLMYTDRELYIWPFFAVGTLYGDPDVFIYRSGYKPRIFQPSGSMNFPESIELIRCSPGESKNLMVTMAAEKFREDRWRGYIRRELSRKLK